MASLAYLHTLHEIDCVERNGVERDHSKLLSEFIYG